MADFPQIPGYRIERELGRGGMARVYLALDEKLERHVALKVLLRSLTEDENITRRFLKEAKTAAKLRHSHIVSIYNVGQHRNHFYFSMECLEENLRQRIQRGPIPAKEAFVIIRQIAGALDYAHSESVVHRDIKPENIMLRRDGEVILTDFGIAKTLGSGTRLTETGMSIGTPHYMSPEQARGKDLDGRADIYSLGVVLFEMLTGNVPYEAEDSVAVAIKHIQEPIPVLQPHLVRYQPLIDAMMAKDREERLHSGAELAELIIAVEAGSRQSETHQDSRFESTTPQETIARLTKKAVLSAHERLMPGDGSSSYGTDAKIGKAKNPNRPRNILIVGLAGLLVVAVGLLIYLLSKGEKEPAEAMPAPSVTEGGQVSSQKQGGGTKSSYEEERERQFMEYLLQAEKYYERGDYQRAKRNVELASGIRRNPQLETLERNIQLTVTRPEKPSVEKEAARLKTEQQQAESRAEDAAWEIALTVGTEEAFGRYISLYPTGRHIAEARQRNEEAIVKARAHVETETSKVEEKEKIIPAGGQMSLGPKTTLGQLVPIAEVDTPPSLIRRVEPDYPPVASKMKAEGTVIVNALIDEFGAVIRTEVLRQIGSHQGFEKASREAVMKWRYKPAIKDGVYVKVWLPVAISFRYKDQ